jgi:hypothetical protein
MKHIKGFYELNENLIPGGWPQDWKNMPEWTALQQLGFIDATTPAQERNGTIMLKNERIYFYPAGIVLQASGYIRDKSKTSGWIKNYNYTPYSLKTMFDYLIERYSKETERTTRNENHGDLSDEIIEYLNNCIKTDWMVNPKTGKIDVKGSVVIKTANSNILNNIKFGVVKGNFSVRNTPITNLRFAPDKVGGNFDCSYTNISSLEGCPEYIGGSFECTSCNIQNLEGSPRHVKGGFAILGMDNIFSFSGAPERIDGDFFFSRRGNFNLRTNMIDIKWNPEGWLKGFIQYPELFMPVINDSSAILRYVKNDPILLAKIYHELNQNVREEILAAMNMTEDDVDQIRGAEDLGFFN